MRHAKYTRKLGRTGSHNRCMIANMLKSLIDKGRICTTIAKAKHLRRYADRMVTFAKKDTLASRRLAKARLMIRYNTLNAKQRKQVKSGNLSSYNADRRVIKKLFTDLKERFANRAGGYTRILRLENRVGDNAEKCIIEYLQE